MEISNTDLRFLREHAARLSMTATDAAEHTHWHSIASACSKESEQRLRQLRVQRASIDAALREKQDKEKRSPSNPPIIFDPEHAAIMIAEMTFRIASIDELMEELR